jgi:hypothetical protein
MLIFFLIAFTVYFLTNLYIYIKGLKTIPPGDSLRLLYTIALILLASAFIAGKILERNNSTVFTDILNIIGGFWLGFMLYAFLLLIISDISLLILRLSGILKAENVPLFKKWSYLVTLAISSVLIIGGFINALIPVTKEYDIIVNKPAGGLKNLRIAAVSDIHLGSIIRKRSIKKLSVMLQKTKPDIVFLLGDIVDGDLGPVLRDDLLSYFTCPKCKDGLLAITGNHEFIGGASITIPYIEKNGIRILKDEVVTLNGGIQIVGRIDRDGFRFDGKRRLSLEELMKQVDKNKPIILLDHQPVKLGEAENEGVDLQLSGHTHNGQLWPLNYVTRLIYEVSYGYKRKANTQYIVSSGFGIWGPRIRSGSRSEVLLINVTFSGN